MSDLQDIDPSTWSTKGLFVPFQTGLVTVVIEGILLIFIIALINRICQELFRLKVFQSLLEDRLYVPYKGWLCKLDPGLPADNIYGYVTIIARLTAFLLVFFIGLEINGRSVKYLRMASEGSIIFDWEVNFKTTALINSSNNLPPQVERCRQHDYSIHLSPRLDCPNATDHPPITLYRFQLIKEPGRDFICYGRNDTIREVQSSFLGLPETVTPLNGSSPLSQFCGGKPTTNYSSEELGILGAPYLVIYCPYGISVFRENGPERYTGWGVTTGNLRLPSDSKKEVVEILGKQLQRHELGQQVNTRDFMTVQLFEFGNLSSTDPGPIIIDRVVNGTQISVTGFILMGVLTLMVLALSIPLFTEKKRTGEITLDPTSARGLVQIFAMIMGTKHVVFKPVWLNKERGRRDMRLALVATSV